MTTFDADYWARQREQLGGTQIRQVNFALFVAAQCGNTLRYVENVGWHRWNGRVWESAPDNGAAMQAITDAAKVLMRRAVEHSEDMTWATRAANVMLVTYQRRDIASEMAVLPELRTTVDVLDRARHLLTFRNGTVDLRTGELKPHDPGDMLTQCARVDYVADAKAPRWERFVEEVFPGDVELQRYFQTFLGYGLTGEVREHALGVWYGAQGRNGKGTTIRTLQAVFGKDLVKEVPFTTFELTRGQTVHTEVIAGLRKARIVVAQEGNDGATMNTALLKNFSGGDVISTRHLHGKQFEFDPKFTLILATNHLPEFTSGGAALWARTRAVLFGESFTGARVDRDLEPTIQGPEVEGVAAWVVEGAKQYYAEGLQSAGSVEAATDMHRESVDPLKDLVGELFDYANGCEVKRSDFNRDLKSWRDDQGEKAAKFTPSAVKRQLLSNGVEERKTKGRGWVYVGLYLMSDVPHGIQADNALADAGEAGSANVFGIRMARR